MSVTPGTNRSEGAAGACLETGMPVFTVDLHNHTPLIPSDWRGRPGTSAREIVETALERGIDVWGIADHFSVDYAPVLLAAAEEVAAETRRRLLVVPGAELKVRHEGDEVHLVCLFPPHGHEVRFRTLLSVLGLTSPVAPVHELPFVTVKRDPVHVARIVEALGGICHVGHVDRTFGEYRLVDSALAHRLAESDEILAVEMLDAETAWRFRDGCAFACIHSSDAHALEEIGRRTTTLEMPELSFEGLREGLRLARNARANGAPSVRRP